jgi:hypothetical protein
MNSNMNCEQYREALAARPDESSAEAAAHVAQCAECAAFRRDIQSLEKLIVRALHIDVPELRLPELAPVDGGSRVVRPPFPRMSAPVWLGLAASVAIATVLGIRFLTNDAVQPSLAAAILEHRIMSRTR